MWVREAPDLVLKARWRLRVFGMKLPDGWELPEAITSRLGRRRAGRQRAIAEDGHVLLILHRPPAKDVDEPAGVLFWRDPSAVWRSSERGAGGGLPAMRELLAEYAAQENQLESEHNHSTRAAMRFSVLERLAPLARASTHLYETLQAARTAIGPDPEVLDLRDEAYVIQRSFELLYTEVKHSLEYDIARRAEQQADLSHQAVQSAHKLNTLMALFLPLTAVASVFGMNLPSGIDHLSANGFWGVLFAALLLGWLVRLWVLKPSK
jgi:hypothetical protein